MAKSCHSSWEVDIDVVDNNFMCYVYVMYKKAYKNLYPNAHSPVGYPRTLEQLPVVFYLRS